MEDSQIFVEIPPAPVTGDQEIDGLVSQAQQAFQDPAINPVEILAKAHNGLQIRLERDE